MPVFMKPTSRIRLLVRTLQMLRQWRKKSAKASRHSRGWKIPADVPKGHLALYVGTSRRRFIVRASYLNCPAFQSLLREAEEMYGFDHAGPIVIPCDEFLFEEIIRLIGREADEHSSVSSECLPRISRIQPSFFPATTESRRRCDSGRLLPESTPLLAAGITTQLFP